MPHEFPDVTPEIEDHVTRIRRAIQSVWSLDPTLCAITDATLLAFDDAVARHYGEIVAAQVAFWTNGPSRSQGGVPSQPS
jgi:hypothetical protein